MSHYVLDTSAYSHFQRGDPQVVDLIDGANWLGLPAIVVGELEVGFLLGASMRRVANRAVLREFIENSVVEELGIDHQVGLIFAEILVALRKSGTKIPTNDLWIAAIAARNGVSVLTYDNHFERIKRAGSVILRAP